MINIVDFRDTDGTMTHWVNPDVVIAGVPACATTGDGDRSRSPTCRPSSLRLRRHKPATTPSHRRARPPATPATTTIPLDQWGMEYNPVAINEVLAYSFVNSAGGSGDADARANRFFIELVNTQTSPEISTSCRRDGGVQPGAGSGRVCVQRRRRMQRRGAAGSVFRRRRGTSFSRADDPYSRPDPYRGQLVPYANLYAATPLSSTAFKPAPTAARHHGAPTPVPHDHRPWRYAAGTATDGYNVMLQAAGRRARSAFRPPVPGVYPITSAAMSNLTGATYPIATNYFYVFGNAP